jgi:hypothetical protein
MGVLEFLGKNKVSPELRGGNGNSLIFLQEMDIRRSRQP